MFPVTGKKEGNKVFLCHSSSERVCEQKKQQNQLADKEGERLSWHLWTEGFNLTLKYDFDRVWVFVCTWATPPNAHKRRKT